MSKGEEGVKEAVKTCVDRYLVSVIANSGAKVIVCLGDFTADAIRSKFVIQPERALFGPLTIGQYLRYLAFLPHTAGRVKAKTFPACKIKFNWSL